MKCAFLDANVLFSAAWRPDAGLTRLWMLPKVDLLSSRYACEEARRNLPTVEQQQRLERLVVKLQLSADVTAGVLPPEVVLPEKDRPILLSAIHSQATYLLTGDRQHFGGLYGQTIEGVTVMRPADFLSLAITE
jgi:predicted nucleic acid-binding protein